MAGSAGGGGGVGAAGGAAGAYGQGSAARPNPKDFATTAQLKDIRFDFDRYEVRAEDAEILDANAESMKANMALADRRAKASMNYLVSRGVRSNRITIISYGKERPMCAQRSEDCWSQNRRAHFLVKGQ